jgi:hypothetical protein
MDMQTKNFFHILLLWQLRADVFVSGAQLSIIINPGAVGVVNNTRRNNVNFRL